MKVAVGENNQIIKRVNFTFSQSDFTKAFLSLKGADSKQRWDIPEEIVPKMHEDTHFRVDMAGLNVNH